MSLFLIVDIWFNVLSIRFMKTRLLINIQFLLVIYFIKILCSRKRLVLLYELWKYLVLKSANKVSCHVLLESADRGLQTCSRAGKANRRNANAREISCLIEILLSLVYSRMVLMVVCWRYRMPFDANGCVPMLMNVGWIKWIYFCVNEFEFGVNNSIFSGNEQQ